MKKKFIQICFFLYHNNQNKFKDTYKHTYKHIYKHGKIIHTEFERLKPELTAKVRDNYNEYRQSKLGCYHTYRQRMVDTEAIHNNKRIFTKRVI